MTEPVTPPVSAPAPAPKVTWWHYHRRLYNWMLSFAHRPAAWLALLMFSLVEAIFFPPPPDVLMIPMMLERPRRAWFYAGVCTAGSIVGGVIAYGIGYWIGPAVQRLFATLHLASQQDWTKLGEWTHSFAVLTAAAIIFHPYKVFTIGCGVIHRSAEGGSSVPLTSFVAASLVGRGLRFFVIAGLLRHCGEPVARFIDRYFHIVSIAAVVLLILGFFLLKVL